MPGKQIPNIIINRLPIYLRALRNMDDAGQITTSSQELGEQLGISAAQIRKDLSQFGGFGKQGTGYPIPYLIKQLQQILKVDQQWDMALVGAGNLGHAIARYSGFVDCGFNLVMVFDTDPAIIGTVINGMTVQHIDHMVQAIRSAGIKVAMLTVPDFAAQQVANELVKAGIQAILNYAPVNLVVPPTVQVQHIDPVLHLQRMTYYLP